MNDPRETKRPPDGGRADNVFSDLAARIKRAQGDRPAQAMAERMRNREMTGIGRAFRLASEFAAAIFVGAGLGWGVDRLFGTAPWGMIVLLLLGFAAGVVNVIRATAEINAAQAKEPMPPSIPDDEDDDAN